MADEVASAAELVMGKASAIPVAIVRGLDPDWFRDGSVNELIRSPRTTSSDERAGVPRGAAVDPRVHRRAGARARRSTRWSRPRASRRRRTTPGRGGSSSSTPRRQARPRRPGWAQQWRADLAADGMDPARIDELVEASHRKLARRARARARLPHLGRPGPLPGRDPPTGRVGHGPAVARRRGREPHGRGGRRRARVVLGGGADLLPRGARATRSRSRPSGCRTRSCSSGTPTPRTSAGPAPRSRSSSSARSGSAARERRASGPRRAGPGTTRACARRRCRGRSRASSRGGSRPGPGRAPSAAAHRRARARGSARP